jgi:hypothetical protein
MDALARTIRALKGAFKKKGMLLSKWELELYARGWMAGLRYKSGWKPTERWRRAIRPRRDAVKVLREEYGLDPDLRRSTTQQPEQPKQHPDSGSARCTVPPTRVAL